MKASGYMNTRSSGQRSEGPINHQKKPQKKEAKDEIFKNIQPSGFRNKSTSVSKKQDAILDQKRPVVKEGKEKVVSAAEASGGNGRRSSLRKTQDPSPGQKKALSKEVKKKVPLITEASGNNSKNSSAQKSNESIHAQETALEEVAKEKVSEDKSKVSSVPTCPDSVCNQKQSPSTVGQVKVSFSSEESGDNIKGSSGISVQTSLKLGDGEKQQHSKEVKNEAFLSMELEVLEEGNEKKLLLKEEKDVASLVIHESSNPPPLRIIPYHERKVPPAEGVKEKILIIMEVTDENSEIPPLRKIQVPVNERKRPQADEVEEKCPPNTDSLGGSSEFTSGEKTRRVAHERKRSLTREAKENVLVDSELSGSDEGSISVPQTQDTASNRQKKPRMEEEIQQNADEIGAKDISNLGKQHVAHLKKNTVKKGQESLQCLYCNKFYARRSSLKKHTMTFHSPDGVVRTLCHYCGKSYRCLFISSHEKICKTKKWSGRRRQDCPQDDCNSSFFRKEELIDHMQSTHKMLLEPMQTLLFKNERDFKEWKEEEEDRTFSFYTKQSGLKKHTNTYYCQHEGTEKMHRKRTEIRTRLLKQNRKGRIKSGKACTSYMKSKFTDEGVVVYYWPSHSHSVSPDDVKHQPLTDSTMSYVREQLLLNVPARQIQAAVKKRISESPAARRRDFHISLKRINNLARRLEKQQPKACEDAVEIFNAYIEVLCAQEDSPVILYQPPMENINICPNEEDHLFFVGLQTADQRNMLERDTAMPMFIGCAKSDYTLNYYVITLAVPSESNSEYPVGHLISSHMNEEVLTIFLQTIGERCPDLSVNCIVSDDFPELNSAIRSVFGSDGPYFLSKWHFLESVKNNLLSSVPPKHIEGLFDFILAMADAETEEKLIFLHDSFKEQYHPKFPDVLLNFEDIFARRTTWASCYRQFPDMIDSSLYVDTFFQKLNKLYRRRHNKNMNLLVELLLVMQDYYKDKRENNQMENKDAELMVEQHNAAVEIPSDLVKEILLHHWTVRSSKHGQEFCVMQCFSKCEIEECSIKCEGCINLCSHMYFCTCGKNESICAHVHKIYMDHGFYSETGIIFEDVNDNFEDASNASFEGAKNVNFETITGSDFDLVHGSPSPPDKELPSIQGEVVGDQEDLPNEENNAAQLVSSGSRKFSILKNLEALKLSVEKETLSDNFLCVIDDTLQNLLVDCDFLNS